MKTVKFAQDIIDKADAVMHGSEDESDEDDTGFFMNPLLVNKKSDGKKKH
jgi:hypothetical protein